MILVFKRDKFLEAIDQMESNRHRIQYIIDLTQSAASTADPQLRRNFRDLIQKLDNLEESYRRRIEGAEEIVENYDSVEQQIFSSLEDARQEIQKIFT